MLRDMKLHKIQFISIFLMALLSVFIYSGISSEWNGLQNKSENYYQKTNLANVWLIGQGFTPEAEETVRKLDGVTGTERRLTVNAIADYDNSPVLRLHFAEKGSISTCLLTEGEGFTAKKDGIWLDYLFAGAKNIAVGDTLSFTINGFRLQKKVMGLVMNPEYVYAPPAGEIVPNHNSSGFGYLSAMAWPEGVPMAFSELMITTDRKTDSAFEEAVDTALRGRYSVFLTREQKESYMQFSTEIEEHKAMGSIFPVAFLLVALLTILTTMIRLVNNQRTQIGVLKALGFGRRKISFHYISFGLWLSLAGSILGAILGPITLPYLFYAPLKTMFTLPEWGPEMTLSTIGMVALTVVSCTLVAFFACNHNLKCTPAQALRPKAPKAVRHTRIEKSGLWRSLGFNAQWNLRDAFRSKVRSLMAIVGVVGCTALMLCALGMQDSMDKFSTWNFRDINRYQSEIALSENATQEQTDRLIADYHGEAIMESTIEVKAIAGKKTGELLVTDQVTLVKNYDAWQKPITLPKDGITISYRLAKLLKVSVGDEISWHIYGQENWQDAKIAAINRKPISQGITVSREYFEGLGYRFRPTSIITPEQVPTTLKEENTGVTKVWEKEELIENYNKMTEAMNVLIYVLILAAIVLAVVVLYNLGVLSFLERQRELSTLKVIGFKTGKIRSLLFTQNLWMTALGVLVGIPVGRWLLDYIFQFLGNSFDFITVINMDSYLYSILGTFLVSILVNRLFSRRIKSLDMVSSLKGVE